MAYQNFRFRFMLADDEHVFALTETDVLRWPNDGSHIVSSTPTHRALLPALTGRGIVHAFSGGQGRIYVIDDCGDLYLMRFVDGRIDFSGQRIGTEWGQFLHVFSDGEGAIYAIAENGDLRFYRDLDRNGHWHWSQLSGEVIDRGWNRFIAAFSGGGGTIYAVEPGGALYWFRDFNRNGVSDWGSAPIGARIGSDWHLATHLFPGKPGEIFFLRTQEFGGTLFRYKDNARNGTDSGWVMPAPAEGLQGWQCIPLEGYAWPISAAPGEKVGLHLSSVRPEQCSVQLLRLLNDGVTEPAAAEFRVAVSHQQASDSAWQDGCGWAPTTEIAIPISARSGLYVARCRSRSGRIYDVPIVVLPWHPGRPVRRATVAGIASEEVRRGLTVIGPGGTVSRRAREGDFALVANVNTWNAYNTWGGYSNYTLDGIKTLSHQRPNHHFFTGSQEHPNGNHLLRGEASLLGWLLQRNYRVDVYTDLDIHQSWFDFEHYRGVILGTHPEYWSRTMIDKLRGYRDRGGRVVYLGGNAMYRPVAVSADAAAITTDTLASNDASEWTQRRAPANPAHDFWRGQDPDLLGITLGTLEASDNYRGMRIERPPAADIRNRPYKFLRSASSAPPGTWAVADEEIVGAHPPPGFRPAYGLEMEWTTAGSPGAIALASDELVRDRKCLVYREGPGGAGWSFGVGSVLLGQSLHYDSKLAQIIAHVLDECLAS